MRSRLPGLAAAVIVVVAACGGEPPAQGDPSGDPGATPPPPTPDTVRVHLGEYFIDMPDTLTPRVRALRVTNDGMHVHDLWVRPERGDSALTAFATPLDPGESRNLPLDLAPGRYYLNCQVANHEGRGMYHTLVVVPEAES